jgi:hypothetical protein
MRGTGRGQHRGDVHHRGVGEGCGPVATQGRGSLVMAFDSSHRMQTWYCLMFALLVMGFLGAAECCNYIAAYLKAGLQLSP